MEFTEFLKSLLTSAGICGLLLGYHMLKLAPELRAIWRALDRRTRIDCLRLLSIPGISKDFRQEVQAIIDEIGDEEQGGKSRERIPP
jgi:hypothetical protein